MDTQENRHKRRVIIISESVMNEISEELEMTEWKFYQNIKKFLSDLYADPVNAQPPLLLRKYGLKRSYLINMMISLGMLEKKQKINDTDENGEPRKATMKVSFSPPSMGEEDKEMEYKARKKNFERNVRKMYMRIFERNLPERQTDELEENEAGVLAGATSGISSGEVIQPLFQIQRRKMPGDMDEATATTNAGNYEYTVAFPGDEETMKRKNGVGGSVSVNNA